MTSRANTFQIADWAAIWHTVGTHIPQAAKSHPIAYTLREIDATGKFAVTVQSLVTLGRHTTRSHCGGSAAPTDCGWAPPSPDFEQSLCGSSKRACTSAL